MKLSEITYFTDHVKEMTNFYRALLEIEPVAQSEDMAIFFAGEIKIFIHRNYSASEGDLPPENHVAFQVTDVDARCQALIKQGLKMEFRPEDYSWGRSAYLRDPDGHQIEITKEQLRD